MPIPLRVLIVEDSEDDALHLLRLLRVGGYDVSYERVDTQDGMRAALVHRAWDLVVSDFQMPGFGGPAALALLRERDADLPFIVVSAIIGEDTAVAMMKAGASDYVMKKNLARLVPAVERELRDAKARQDGGKAREALQESEQRFRQLAENIREVFWLTDPSKNEMLYVSPAYEEIWGRKVAALYVAPQDWLDAIHAEDRERVLAAAGTKQIRGDYDEVYRITRPDGAIRWIRDRAFPVLDEAGAVVRVAGVAEDITEPKRVTDELRESERRFSELLGNVQLVSMMLDRQGRITYGNDYLLRLTGWKRDEVLGRNWFELFLPAPHDGMNTVFAAMLADAPEAWHHENAILTRSGERRLVRWSNSVLRSASGEVIGTASIGEDITEKAEAELRIGRLNRVNGLLSGVNTAIVRIRDRQALFQEACRIAVQTGGLRFAWLCVVDEREMRLKPVAFAGEAAGFMDMIQVRLSLADDAPEGHGIGARCVREKRALAVNDVQADGNFRNKEVHAELGIRSVAALPLIAHGKVVGAFGLHSGEAGFFNDGEMKLLAEVSANIAFALEHIEKEEKVARLTRVYAVLSGINSLIVRVKSAKELFEESCRLAVEAGRFKLAWIGTVDRERQRIRPEAWRGGTKDYIDLMPLDLVPGLDARCGLAAEAVTEKRAVIVADMTTDARVSLTREAVEHGYRSLVILPLAVSGEVVGVLALYAAEADFFDEREMKLLLELAGDISFALDHIDKADRVEYLALYDSLTGLANRTLFLERVGQKLIAAGETHRKVAVVALDLDRFKTVNDGLGRQAGDELLKQVATRLRTLGRDDSRLARVAGDHFAIVISEAQNEGELARLTELRLKECFGPPFLIGESEVRVSGKVGIAVFPSDGADAETLLRNAGEAVKKAKASSEPYMFYTQEMSSRIAGKLGLETKLRRALENDEFVLHYQPKVDLRSRGLLGVEALIRWRSPDQGLVPPVQFIPLMEETGMILEVGAWALSQAVADHRRWADVGLAPPRIAVNVSAIQLRKKDFLQTVKDAVRRGASPSGLDLEITESVIMEDIADTIQKLKEVQSLGISVAIDDFGTGYSSLAYLAKLPVQTLKIDRSFITTMLDDPDTMTLVQTIISLAHSLRLKVVAEGVETPEQAKILALLGCDEMQGYLYSKPVPFDALTDMLRTREASALSV